VEVILRNATMRNWRTAMNKSLVTVSIRRDRIQFEDYGGDHFTGRETQEAANFWESEMTSAIDAAGYVADVDVGYDHDHRNYDVNVEAGNIVIYGTLYGPDGWQKLTPAQAKFFKAVMADMFEADTSAGQSLEDREAEIVADQSVCDE